MQWNQWDELPDWQVNTNFSFSRVEDSGNAKITIGFESGDHGDRFPFDGPSPSGPTIAHALAPTDGRFHYDAEEKWAVGAIPGSIDMETVALHGIGHLLGLDHSEVEGAIMWHSSQLDPLRGCIQMILMVLGLYIRSEFDKFMRVN
ncbi:hypothetical protein LWI28_003782 [Acer negundo]|uniref:Peptidase metallopeptidase domain-containing protein n=1 Tax=Acer negundo TaxID=4023 RepID=A0AAD5NWD6_ACENE|nr:hypothetical protein LWI28_003782 [Acer negundo]